MGADTVGGTWWVVFDAAGELVSEGAGCGEDFDAGDGEEYAGGAAA